MNQYPDAVTTIANDYLGRVKVQLRSLPAMEQEDFLREVRSHLYDAYEQTPGEDDVAKILGVLRNFGEPADVVSDRLPGAMVRSGTRKNLPLYIIGGMVIALFGIPLGFGGFGVLLGLLAALAGILIAYYAVTGMLFFMGSIIMIFGVARAVFPELWERLVELGYIQTSGDFGDFLDTITPTDQGIVLILFASVFLAAAWGLFRLGKHLLRGLRFLFSLTFEWMRRFAASIRRKLRRDGVAIPRVGVLSFAADE